MIDTATRLASLAEGAEQSASLDMDDPAVKAAYLFGYDRPHRRTPVMALLAEGEYHLGALAHARTLPEPDGLVAYHLGELSSIREECTRRLAVKAGYTAPSGLTPERIFTIKEAVPFYEVAERFGACNLKPAQRGVRWVGLCPFHTEKTPSFSAWKDHGHCFGSCGWSGDVFAFVQATMNVTFRDACRVLADYAGLPDPTIPPPRAGRGMDL